MKYHYLLGSFQNSDFNFSIIGDIEDNDNWTEPIIDGNFTLYQLNWIQFANFVDEIDENNININNLEIIMYSTKKCDDGINTNNTDPNDNIGLKECIDEWWYKNNGTDPPNYLFYTEIKDETYMEINSEAASQTFDGPRDTFMFLIMTAMFIWIFLMMDAFEDPSS